MADSKDMFFYTFVLLSFPFPQLCFSNENYQQHLILNNKSFLVLQVNHILSFHNCNYMHNCPTFFLSTLFIFPFHWIRIPNLNVPNLLFHIHSCLNTIHLCINIKKSFFGVLVQKPCAPPTYEFDMKIFICFLLCIFMSS